MFGGVGVISAKPPSAFLFTPEPLTSRGDPSTALGPCWVERIGGPVTVGDGRTSS